MKTLPLLLLFLSLGACAGIPFERTYSATYEDASGRKVGAGVTLKPRSAKTVVPLSNAGMFRKWQADTRRISPLSASSRIRLRDYEELHTNPDL